MASYTTLLPMRRLIHDFRSFGKLSVTAERKWTDIFRHCNEWLGAENGQLVDSAKAWSIVAIAIANGKKSVRENR